MQYKNIVVADLSRYSCAFYNMGHMDQSCTGLTILSLILIFTLIKVRAVSHAFLGHCYFTMNTFLLDFLIYFLLMDVFFSNL